MWKLFRQGGLPSFFAEVISMAGLTRVAEARRCAAAIALVVIFCASLPGVVAGALPAQELPAGAPQRADSVPDEPGNPRVAIELETDGEIVIELFPAEAPLAVERFLELVDAGFYDGLVFHRVEPWIVQAGSREHDYPPIEGEMFYQNLRHEPGMVGLARLVDDYDSATTQFYIIRERKAVLNREYTLFAKVVAGLDLVMKIEKGTGIRSVRLLP